MNIKVKIKGTSGLMQHKLNLEADQKSKKRKAVFDKVEDAAKSAYVDENGYYVPSTWIEGMLIKAATNYKMAGSGKKSYKDAAKGGLFCTEDKIRLLNKEYEIDVRPVVVPATRGRVLRARPLFRDWELEFTLSVIDDRFDEGVIREIIEYGGNYVGIGDFRPRYGRFVLVDFEVLD